MIQARMTRIGIMPEKRVIISIILDRRQSGEEGEAYQQRFGWKTQRRYPS
jgi:hypothetical protein